MHKMERPFGEGDKEKALRLAKEHEINSQIILAKTQVIALLLECTTVGEFTLTPLREKLIQIYGDPRSQSYNDAYSHVVDVYREVNSQLGKAGTITDLMKVRISMKIGIGIGKLMGYNFYLEQRIKYYSTEIYTEKILGIVPRSGFGGGGAVSISKW